MGSYSGGTPPPEKPWPSSLDLNSEKHNVSVSPVETAADADHRRWKEKLQFILGWVVILLVLVGCAAILIWGSPSPDDKRWLQSVITAIFGGIVGAAIKGR